MPDLRYTKDEQLLKLAIQLQASKEGISLDDICCKFDVSRRTAERLRDAVSRVFGQLTEIKEGRNKRWRLESGTLSQMLKISSDEIASLHIAKDICTKQNHHDLASQLGVIISKVRAAENSSYSLKIEPDLEALLISEGLAMRPGPKLKINNEHVSRVREAIKIRRELDIIYKSSTTTTATKRTLQPLGILYGTERNYLVAKDKNKEGERLYKLSDIEACEFGEYSFVPPKYFNLQTFAENSFGVYQEKPFNVVWKFSPKVASTAKEYKFHPNQTLEPCADGSLIVRFVAGGRREMDWHLYTWGGEVEDLTEY